MNTTTLIPGLTLLETINNSPSPAQNVVACFAMFILGLMSIAFGGLLIYWGYDEEWLPLTIFGIISVILGLILIFGSFIYEPTTQIAYRVLIADDVNINDVIAHYNILSVEGDIFTIEPK